MAMWLFSKVQIIKKNFLNKFNCLLIWRLKEINETKMALIKIKILEKE